MKKILSVMLAVFMLAFLFAGCADKTQQTDDADVQGTEGDSTQSVQDSKGDDSSSDTPVIAPDETPDDGIPELIKPWEANPLNGGYISPEAEALVTVTKAYLARSIWLQYDCSRLMKDLSGVAKVTRPQYHTNSPEDCTSQNTGYTNCSAFTYDVFWETFGLDIKASGTNALRDSVDMHVFTYYITGNETPYERRLVEQNFLNSLQQGDIIACDHPSPGGGHALMYIGDGMMIDSAYFSSKGGGDYNHSKNHDNTEVNGSVRTREVMSFFEEDNYYYFWDEACWSIVRPLKKYTDAKITFKTQARVANLKDIYVEKISSHTMGQSADIGEEITFTFYIRNDRTTDASLHLTAQVPLNTVYVSGGDTVVGRSLKWDVAVAAGKELEVSYTVRVNSDPALYGSTVSGEGSAVGGVDVKCPDIYIGKHLSQKQMNAISAVGANAAKMSQRGIELARAIYLEMGSDINLADAEALIDSLFVQYKDTTHYQLNTNSKYISMVVPVMYGGYLCMTSELFDGARTYGIFGKQIYPGDIILAREKTEICAYMLLSQNQVLDLTKGKILYNLEATEVLLSLLGRDVFAVIRPGVTQ